jgi:hypothetical protein
MPYIELKLQHGAPSRVKQLLRVLEDHYLRDVHTMLRLPVTDFGLSSGCNFAVTQVLTATISGVSVTLYSHSGGKGKRFMDSLVDYYPWDLEPASRLSPQECAGIIYKVFRNPLTHDLGFDLEKKAKTSKVLIKRLSNNIGGLSENLIEQIENTSKRFSMSSTITVQPDATILLVEALYWGMRVMLERLTADIGRMQKADSFLASI